MRLLLILLVAVALFIDALFYSGRYTQFAYSNVTVAAEQLVDVIGEAVKVGPEREAES